MNGPANVLRVTRVVKAAPERVFAAWTEAELLKRWWGPMGFSTSRAEVDLRVGGRYRLHMQPPAGDPLVLHGSFREVLPPRRLVYDWQWEGDPTVTLVTVEFLPVPGGTEVRIVHERFPTKETLDRHAEGWAGCLDRLSDLLADAA